jgi:hypothetical protein
MLSLGLALLKKAAPYLAPAIMGLAVGLYFGCLIGAERLAAARLALAMQQASDAKAVAAADATAAAELTKASADANVAEAALTVSNARSNTEETSLTRQIAALVGQPGQDATDAPILAHVLDTLEAAQ